MKPRDRRRRRLSPALAGAVLAALALLLAACGSRPPVRLEPPAGDHPELTAAYDQAVEALDAGQIGDARGRLEKLAREAKGTPLEPYVELQLGRIAARSDAGRGSDRLLKLAAGLGDHPVAREARLYGGLAAVDAKRCITARRELAPLAADPPDARALRGLARCEAREKKPIEALALLERAAQADADGAAADRETAATLASAMALADAAKAVQRFGDGPLGEPLRRRLLALATAADDRRLMDLAREGLPADDPAVAAATRAAKRARLGVILPLSGRSRPLGRDLEALVSALYGEGEDRPAAVADLRVRDGGDPAKAAAAVQALATDDGVFAAVGVFDSKSASAAARAAAEAGLPLVMLTLSDAPLSVDGPVWRALPTPALVVGTAAGAGLAAGGKVAAVARASDRYGETHARLFAQAWQAGGGRVIGEIAWDPKKADYAAVAKQLAGAEFDTLFVPADPTGAAELMRHLAAQGIWARGAEKRFAGEKGVREVRVIGTPSWYRPDLPRLGGRYVEGVRVPVSFAAETARGAPFAARVRGAVGRAPTAFDALLVDALGAMERAWSAHLAAGTPAPAALRGLGVVEGATSGLDFRGRDALPALFVLEVTRDGFRPAK